MVLPSQYVYFFNLVYSEYICEKELEVVKTGYVFMKRGELYFNLTWSYAKKRIYVINISMTGTLLRGKGSLSFLIFM